MQRSGSRMGGVGGPGSGRGGGVEWGGGWGGGVVGWWAQHQPTRLCQPQSAHSAQHFLTQHKLSQRYQ